MDKIIKASASGISCKDLKDKHVLCYTGALGLTWGIGHNHQNVTILKSLTPTIIY